MLCAVKISLVGVLVLAEVHGSAFKNSQAAYREEVTSPPCKPLNHNVLESLYSVNL